MDNDRKTKYRSVESEKLQRINTAKDFNKSKEILIVMIIRLPPSHMVTLVARV